MITLTKELELELKDIPPVDLLAAMMLVKGMAIGDIYDFLPVAVTTNFAACICGMAEDAEPDSVRDEARLLLEHDKPELYWALVVISEYEEMEY